MKTEELGKAFCSHCAWSTEYLVEDEVSVRDAATLLTDQARGCKSNPLVAELAQARASLAYCQETVKKLAERLEALEGRFGDE